MSEERPSPSSGTVYVLSPHPDDACFSAGLAILAWRRSGLEVRVVSCFTRTGFVRGRRPRDPEEVSRLRAAEDRDFVRRAGLPDPLDLGRVDAPLRRGTSVRAVFGERPFDAEDRRETDVLAADLLGLPDPGALVAPLGLGGHLDHRIVREAALRLDRIPRAFYEDLPYAATLGERARAAAAAAVAERTGLSLRPVVVRVPDGARTKLALARCYGSQVRWRDLQRLARAAEAWGGGERLWLEDEALFLAPPDFPTA